MTTGTELTLPERVAIALGTTQYEIKLRDLVTASASIVKVTNADGREQAHRAAMNLRNARTAITKTGKAARDDANAFSKAVIAEEARLIAIIEPEEERVFLLRDQWDADREAEKQAKIAAEKQRVAAIQARITALRNLPLAAVDKSSVEISQMIFQLSGRPNYDEFAEFAEEYKAVRFSVLDQLAKAETAARHVEHEASRLKAEREELERQRVEQEALLAEQRRKDLAEHAARYKAELAERDRQEAALRIERERLAAERAEIARVQADLNRQQAVLAEAQRQREELAAKEAEAERIKLQAPVEQVIEVVQEPSASESKVVSLPNAAWPFPLTTAIKVPDRPTDAEIIDVLAQHYCVNDLDVIEWLGAMDLEAASRQLAVSM